MGGSMVDGLRKRKDGGERHHVHLARELGELRLAVTAVSPGHVATELADGNAPLTRRHDVRRSIVRHELSRGEASRT